MMPIKALSLFVLAVDDKRVNGNLGPSSTVYCIPQQGASEFETMIGGSDGKASQTRDGNRRIARQTLSQRGGHPGEENAARRQRIVSGDPACRDRPGWVRERDRGSSACCKLIQRINVQ